MQNSKEAMVTSTNMDTRAENEEKLVFERSDSGFVFHETQRADLPNSLSNNIRDDRKMKTMIA